MAISLLEQRLEPLEVRVPILFPSPSSFPASMETLEEEYGLDGVALAGRRLRRSHTWSGYTSRLQLLDFEQLAPSAEPHPRMEATEQEPESPQVGMGMQRSPSSSSLGFGSFSGSSDWAQLLEEEQEELTSRRSSLSTTASSSPSSAASRAWPQWLGKLSSEEAKGPEAGAQKRAPRRKVQKKKAATSPFHLPSVTTFMVQNLARNTTRHRFLEALNALGFADQYDYVHVPTSFQTGRNQGFAFVNFINAEVALRFASQFQAADGTKPEDKLWRVAPADVQGSKANSTAARSGKMAKVRSNAHRPLLFPQVN